MGDPAPDMGVPVKTQPTHPTLHPITNTPISPLGYRKDGREIWPVMGGDGTNPQPQQQPPAPAPQPIQQPPAPAPQQGQPQPQPAQPQYPFQYPPQQPYQQPPAPAPYPAPPPQQPPAPAPQPPAPAPAPAGQPNQPAQGENGFPPNTPWRDMKPDEQVAYWQFQSRKHEQRVQQMGDYEQLRAQAAEYQQHLAANQTEHQRAIADAHRQGATEALAQANSQLVDQWVRAAAAGRLHQESVDALLAGLNRAAFVTNGAVDTDRVWSFVSSLTGAPGQSVPQPPAPASAQPQQQQQPVVQQQPLFQPIAAPAGPTGAPDFGQGQPPAPRPSGLEAGRLLARERFAKSTPPKPTILQ